MSLGELYTLRKCLLQIGLDPLDDPLINMVENLIADNEILPDFEEVITMISDGEMKSIFS